MANNVPLDTHYCAITFLELSKPGWEPAPMLFIFCELETLGQERDTDYFEAASSRERENWEDEAL